MKTTLNELRQLVRQVIKENDQYNQIQHVKSLIFSNNMANVELGCMLISSIDPQISEEEFFEYTIGLIDINAEKYMAAKALSILLKNISIINLLSSTELKVGYKHIAELPENIGQLSQLKNIILIGNKLTRLPESIGQLINLNSFSVIRNDLTTLPESIGRLSQLEELDFSGNKLNFLPESIGQLQSLKSLLLSGNNLITLPKSIKLLSNLRHIEISSNKISYEQQAVIRKSLPKGCEIYF